MTRCIHGHDVFTAGCVSCVLPHKGVEQDETLEWHLASALNRFSAENPSNTPDFILAQFLLRCLAAWNIGVQQRETWYGRDARPSEPSEDMGCEVVSEIERLSRYVCSDVWGMEPADDGEWLKRSDVLAVLASLPTEPQEQKPKAEQG